MRRLYAAAVPDLARLPAGLEAGALLVAAPSPRDWGEQLREAEALARSRALWVVVAGQRDAAGGRRLSAACFGPEGGPLAVQDELFPPAGWQAGDRLELFDLAGWRAAMVVGEDVLWPEVARLATLSGARLLAVPSLYPAEEAPRPAPQEEPAGAALAGGQGAAGAGSDLPGGWAQVAGGWQEVQQNQVFAVESPLEGRLGGRLSRGRPAVWAPCEITPDSRGWLDWAAEPGRPAAAWLEAETLEAIREAYPLERFLNPALYRARLAEAYARMAGGEAR
ncbi:MAG: hypothetical protein QJR08_01320 [Bacillota bacterium]|nr:hypothetical protein [Bacillota bacterium]